MELVTWNVLKLFRTPETHGPGPNQVVVAADGEGRFGTIGRLEQHCWVSPGAGSWPSTVSEYWGNGPGGSDDRRVA